MKNLRNILGITLVLTTKFVLAASPSDSTFAGLTTLNQFNHAVTQGLVKAADLNKASKEMNSIFVAKGKGGVDTGGGTLIKTPSATGLLDLYLYNKGAFYDQKQNPKNLTKTRSFKTFGVERIDNRDNEIVANAIKQIKKWESSSPFFVNLIIPALKGLPIYYHDGSLANEPLEFHIPNDVTVKSADLKMIALYTNDFGVHLGFNDLEKLSETNQIATFIHESLRLITVNKVLLLTNDEIQKVTAQLMSTPKPNETLDRLDYLRGPTLAQIYESTSLYMEFYELRNLVCTQLDLFEKNVSVAKAESEFCKTHGATIESIQKARNDVQNLNVGYIYLRSEELNSEQQAAYADRLNRIDLFVSRARNNQLQGIVNQFQQVTPLISMLKNLLSLNTFIILANDNEIRSSDFADVREKLNAAWKAFDIKIAK